MYVEGSYRWTGGAQRRGDPQMWRLSAFELTSSLCRTATQGRGQLAEKKNIFPPFQMYDGVKKN